MPVQVAGLKLYNLDELSKILEVNKVTLRGYIEQGRLKAVKIGPQLQGYGGRPQRVSLKTW